MSVEDSPEFQKALNDSCEKQYRGWLYGGGYIKASSKDEIADTMDEIQRQREQIEDEAEEYKRYADSVRREAEILAQQAKFQINPAFREITENLKIKYGGEVLICPVCGEGDQGNRINGKPYCFNEKHKLMGIRDPVPLLTSEKVAEWKPPKKSKLKEYTFKEVDGVIRKRLK